MKIDEFNEIIKEQIARSEQVLIKKADEYATDDRLHNFKVAAALQGCTAKRALAGMMAKHTVSVYDLCSAPKGQVITLELWNEKITDSINYLLLLSAVIREGPTSANSDPCNPFLSPNELRTNFVSPYPDGGYGGGPGTSGGGNGTQRISLKTLEDAIAKGPVNQHLFWPVIDDTPVPTIELEVGEVPGLIPDDIH